MSMLSSQCDNLRESAHELSMFAGTLTAPYALPPTKGGMRSAMLEAAIRMEDAADTIWCLREKNLENLKLCELVKRLYTVTKDELMKLDDDEYDEITDCMYELGIDPYA